MVLIDIDVNQKVLLWYKEMGKVRYYTDEFTPEILIYREDGLDLSDLSNFKGILYINKKIIRTVDEELNGFAIGTKLSSFFSIAHLLDRYFNYYNVKMFNIDIRLSIRYLAEKGLFPFFDGKERFSLPDISYLNILKIEKKSSTLKIGEKEKNLTDFNGISNEIEHIDPDIIIFPGGDEIIPNLVDLAKKKNENLIMGRVKGWTELRSREYFSYGREFYKERTLLPKGRILIDPETSFIYQEGGLEGVIMTSRVSGLPASLAARATPGTLVSTMEVYQALKRNIAVPYHKYVAENEKTLTQLINADRGGIVYQPHAGLYWNVKEFDFTSMYPSIIVRKNLSIETLNKNCEKYTFVPDLEYKVCIDREGFLSSALRPLLELRIKTKKLKKFDEKYKGIDNALKWMLVTSFGYTGYRNAKFGSIEIHEAINAYAREYLLQAKEILERNNFNIIHGIVDSLWASGTGDPEKVINEIEKATSLDIDLSGDYYWMKVLPEKGSDVIGSPGKYFALNTNDEFKLRGIMSRRSDSPELVKEFQNECLEILKDMKDKDSTEYFRKKILEIYLKYKERIENKKIEKEKLLIEKRVNKYPWEYSSKTAEFYLLKNYYEKGELKRPGERIRYLVYSTEPIRAVDESKINQVDYSVKFYINLLRNAFEEISP